MGGEPAVPVGIHLLTIDILLTNLIGGQAVSLGGGKELVLASDDARAVLDWYRRNRGRWQSSLSANDTNAIIDAIGTQPPIIEAESGVSSTRAVRLLRLVRVEAHRFAGLHAYGQLKLAPASFVFEPSKQITLAEGVNGSGKTSIANAIIWCLTGHLIRSQRPPEEGPLDIACEIARDDGTTTAHPVSAITPLPPRSAELPPDGEPIPADSWVEVTFADETGALLPPLRRTQWRTSRGKLNETPPDLDAVGVDPIAWRIATTMPALLPFLSVGSASQLGEAVARLTGLADLVDLAKHAGKMSKRIARDAIPEIEKQRTDIAVRYKEIVEDLAAILIETPAIASADVAPAIDDGEASEHIAKLSKHFNDLKVEAFREARHILGDGFDPASKQSRDDLEKNISPAIELLKKVGELPSIARFSALKIDATEIAAVIELLAQVKAEAAILARLTTEPDRARRMQLYAKVSAWMHDHACVDEAKCPICSSQLRDARDPVTGLPIVDHLTEAARDREVISRTTAGWSAHWIGLLLQKLPPLIAAEARTDLPSDPTALLRAGLAVELFESEPFRGPLTALQTDAVKLIDERLAGLPKFAEPASRTLPIALSPGAAELQRIIDRIDRALAFAKWREDASEALKAFLHAVRSGEDEGPDAPRAIGRRLTSLLQIIDGIAPLNAAIENTRRLEMVRTDDSAKKKRISACERAVVALELLVPLGGLAQTQVDTLRLKLHRRSEHWRRAIYRNATTFAPDLTGTDMNANGVLELKVGRDGVAAPAQHVSNASALRGALFGFFLAFREHVLNTRGGLSLLVLDDPQELLDNDNRQRLARGLAAVARSGAQLLVTTHDRQFARSLVAENRADDRIQHLSVHAVNSVHPTLSLSLTVEEVDRRRKEFATNLDSAIDAQNYASDLRVFIEARLSDLFDDLAEPAHATWTQSLTLFPLLDKLRALVANGSGELFSNPILKNFVSDPGLAEGALPRRVLNASHHDKASITYTDVQEVEAAFRRLRTNVEKVHEQFRLHRWREPLAPVDSSDFNVVPLTALARPAFSVQVCPDIAAFVGSMPTGGSQDAAIELLDGGWFEGKALFYVRGETLGFAIPSGAIAIVEADPYPGRDRNLVIAKYQGNVFARRLVKAPNSFGVSLVAQMPDPRNSRPTMTYDESKVRLYRIVGAIFTDMPPPPASGGEATQIETAPELAQIEVAYRVREDSAIPLALPEQVILGGAELKPSDLDRLEGKLVAVTLDDGTSIFKRVGMRLSGSLAHLRQFETIGGLGSSTVIATESVDGGASTPVMASARRVLGVLYE